jgi:hypothetical protein
MHMFVKRCMCLQFSRDADENYEEKRTKLVSGKTCRFQVEFRKGIIYIVVAGRSSRASQS